jgi:enoyl-CoA hydratase
MSGPPAGGPDPPVLVHDEAHVRVITLNRPHVRNALDGRTLALLADVVRDLDRRPDLHVAVLTGAGPAFCSGMDLRAFQAGELTGGAGSGGTGLLPPITTPLIAAVEGWALGGGFELALACDIIVAARDARFGLPEVRHGLLAAGGGLLHLARRLPRGAAAELALTGAAMSGARAAELGLVTRVCEPGAAVAVALDLAGAIAAHPPLAVRATNRLLGLAAWADPDDFTVAQTALRVEIFNSTAARDGTAAFLRG